MSDRRYGNSNERNTMRKQDSIFLPATLATLAILALWIPYFVFIVPVLTR